MDKWMDEWMDGYNFMINMEKMQLLFFSWICLRNGLNHGLNQCMHFQFI